MILTIDKTSFKSFAEHSKFVMKCEASSGVSSPSPSPRHCPLNSSGKGAGDKTKQKDCESLLADRKASQQHLAIQVSVVSSLG